MVQARGTRSKQEMEAWCVPNLCIGEGMRTRSSQDLGFKKTATKVWAWGVGWERVGVFYVGFGLQRPGIQVRSYITQGGSHVYSQPDGKATGP